MKFNRIVCSFSSFKFILFFTTLFTLNISANAESVLHRGNGAEPETMDMHKSTGVPEANIQRDLFEGLVSVAADGSLIPGAAKSWEQDESGKLWTFNLRDDGKWSNGEKVVASDFVNAFQRALSPETASEYAFILWPVKHAKAINKSEIKDVTKLGISAPDDLTLKIELENPTPYLTGLLSHHMTYPVYLKSIEKHGKKWTRPNNLISNGPYQLAEWKPQTKLKVVKNPHYRDADNIHFDTVYFHPTEDTGAELKRFRAGELDVTEDVPSDQLKWIEKNLKANFRNTPYIGTYYFAMNLEQAPFKDNPDLRKALSFAIDRTILTEKVTKAGELPGLSWVPPGMNGYTSQAIPELSLANKERVALAKSLYAKAGYSKDKPLEVELLYNTSENHKKIAIAISAMWKQTLGVKVKLRNEEWKVYLNSRSQRQFQLVRSGWIGDYNDASNFLDLFRSDVGTMNPAGWKNADYDGLMKQAETELDAEKRIDLMQQAEKILLSEMPLIPIYYYTTQHLLSPELKGWVDNVMDIHPSRYLSK
ncbi:MAG: peptide ABC transporter substrate-binding protein [Cocleimonas sp.]